jgi:hypothetical protein
MERCHTFGKLQRLPAQRERLTVEHQLREKPEINVKRTLSVPNAFAKRLGFVSGKFY